MTNYNPVRQGSLPTRGMATIALFWQNVLGIIQNLLPGSPPGSQRSLLQSMYGGTIVVDRRNWDLEIPEFAIREPNVGRQLIEMRWWCPEIATSLTFYLSDLLSSADGDDTGFTVAEKLTDETPVDADVRAIGIELFSRILDSVDLEPILIDLLCYGNAFVSVGIDREGLSKTRDYGISRLLVLPSWEMFRLETNDGNLLGFEQRRSITSQSDLYYFYPPQIVHFRNLRFRLYGSSIWQAAIQDWADLKAGTRDLALASRNLGINPNVHIMPVGSKPEYVKSYRTDYEARLADGVVTDFFQLNGGDVRKLANYNPNLQPLVDKVMLHRKRIIMPTGIPIWRFPGFDSTSAQDIAGQPALAYARTVNGLRARLAKGLTQILQTELILRLGFEEFRKRGQFRIAFPQFAVNINNPGGQPVVEETRETGITDLDL